MTPKSQYDLLIADLHAKRQPEPLLDTEFDEPFGRFSPDGRWLAYVSNESGRFEAYVRRLAGGHFDTSPRILVSPNGGEYPTWDPSGNELYYLGADRNLYGVRFDKTGPAGEPKPMFRVCGVNGYPGEGMGASWDMPFAPGRGGQRFVLRCRPGTESTDSVFAYRDWEQALRP
jgi:hypothetical protein